MLDIPRFVIIIPSYNNIKYVKRNLASVFIQKYPYYRVIYIDDCSEDGTYEMVKHLVTRASMWDRFSLYRQPVRNYASGSRFSAYHLCLDMEILCMLDGDDWLANDQVLNKLSRLYLGGAMVTYGSFKFYKNEMGLNGIYGNELFPRKVLERRSYRQYRWTSQHLRTGYAGLFKRIRLKDMIDKENQFLRCCTDLCEMYAVLEMAGQYIVRCPHLLYIYNKESSLLSNNSFYNQDKFPLEKIYREYVTKKIMNTAKYDVVPKSKLVRKANLLDFRISDKIKSDLLENLLKLMNQTSLNCLGMDLSVKNPLILYNNDIVIGNLDKLEGSILIERLASKREIGELVISVKKLDIDLW